MIEVFNLCGSLPKDDRHTVGERLKNTCMDLNLGICEAHASDDKSEALGRCRRVVGRTLCCTVGTGGRDGDILKGEKEL
jgi:hypothetical protein